MAIHLMALSNSIAIVDELSRSTLSECGFKLAGSKIVLSIATGFWQTTNGMHNTVAWHVAWCALCTSCTVHAL